MPNQNKPLHTDAQAFPLISGKTNLTSGSTLKGSLIYCVNAGSFDITFPDGVTTDTIDMLEGFVFSLPVGSVVDLTGTAGTFHLSN